MARLPAEARLIFLMGGGMPYVVGFLVGWLTLSALAVAIWRTGARRIAILPLAFFASVALFNSGAG